MGVFNTGPWQQSVAFTDPYTSQDTHKVGFAVPRAAAAAFPADAHGRTIGTHGPLSLWFRARMGSEFSPAALVEYPSQLAMWGALTGGAVDAVFTDMTTAQV